MHNFGHFLWWILADLMTSHDTPDGPFRFVLPMFNVSNPGYVVYSIYGNSYAHQRLVCGQMLKTINFAKLSQDLFVTNALLQISVIVALVWKRWTLQICDSFPTMSWTSVYKSISDVHSYSWTLPQCLCNDLVYHDLSPVYSNVSSKKVSYYLDLELAMSAINQWVELINGSMR